MDCPETICTPDIQKKRNKKGLNEVINEHLVLVRFKFTI